MEDRGYGAITVGLDGHVATITLNNPERKNALSPRMVNELLYALDDARDTPAVRVIVLTGEAAEMHESSDQPDILYQLLNNPIQLKSFRPLKRDETHERH